jgi:hypothetical protein
LDEVFETLTLMQTQKIKSFPLVVMGSKFWRPLRAFAKRSLLKQGTIDEEDLSLFTVTDSVDEVLELVGRKQSEK